MTIKNISQMANKNESKQATLKARALLLAQEPEKAVTADELLEVIAFSLGGETYGVESGLVREVYPLRDFTALPGVPAFILGIINVRGQILSVVNLKKFFGLPEKGLGKLNKVIILHNQHMEFGILADDILGVTSILKDAMQRQIPTTNGIGSEFLQGVTPEHLIVLDGNRLLNSHKMIVHEEVDFITNK